MAENNQKSLIKEIPINSASYVQILNLLGNFYCNGKIILKKFLIPQTFQPSVASDMNEGNFLEIFQMNQGLGIISSIYNANDIDYQTKFKVFDFLSFNESLKEILTIGSAYNKINQTEIRTLISLLNGFLLDKDRSEDLIINYFTGAWNSWFFDIFWDYTYLIYGKTSGFLWLLSITDED